MSNYESNITKIKSFILVQQFKNLSYQKKV